MDAIGAQELLVPGAAARASPTRRPAAGPTYGDSIFRLQDRKGADYLLGPTHEEMFTLVVKDLYSSYKDLPLSLYQIQTKYRDEARPRAGAAARPRVRHEGLLLLRRRRRRASSASYQQHREAYIRIFDRLGFDYVIVKATVRRDGRLGVRGVPGQGRRRRGHLRPLHALRLRRQRRGRRGPRARAGAVRRRARPRTPSRRPTPRPSRRWSTTSTRSFPRDDRPWAAGDTLKNVLVVLKHPDGTREPLAIGVPGDREVDQKRLEGQLEPIEVEPMDEAEFAQAPGAGQGLHRPRRAGGGVGVAASATSSTPASSRAPAG